MGCRSGLDASRERFAARSVLDASLERSTARSGEHFAAFL